MLHIVVWFADFLVFSLIQFGDMIKVDKIMKSRNQFKIRDQRMRKKRNPYQEVYIATLVKFGGGSGQSIAQPKSEVSNNAIQIHYTVTIDGSKNVNKNCESKSQKMLKKRENQK